MSIRLDPDLKAALQELADADERSLNAYINRALRQHIEASKKRPKIKSGDK
jgi:predicted transcriptional regulator